MKYLKFYFIILCIILCGCAAKVVKPLEPRLAVKKEGRPGSKTAKKEIKAVDVSFNSDTGEIKYTLPQPALVRIRIGLKDGGPLLRTLVDWQLRPRGPNREVWDKKDASGIINYGNRKDVLLMLACLPVEQKDLAGYESAVRGYRGSPKFDVVCPLSQRNSENALPIIKDIAPIRVILDEQDKKWLTETKYEVAFFIDYVFLIEDEEGVNPFTYLLNTKGINEGEHIITVNVISYQGEVGTKSIKVYVEK